MKRLMIVVVVALTAFAAKCDTAKEGKPEAEKSVIVQKVRSPLGKEIDRLAAASMNNDKFLLAALNKVASELQMYHAALTNLEARLVVFENEKNERDARREAIRAKREKERKKEAAVKTVSDIIKRGKAFERKVNGGK